MATSSVFCILVMLCFSTVTVLAQTQATEEQSAAESEIESIRASLVAILSILDAQTAKRKSAEDLRQAIEEAKTDVDKKELGEKLEAVNAELSKLDDQIVSLATGVAPNDRELANENFELRDELEQLVRPFVWILKAATENARQIEHLKRTLLAALEQEKVATDAIARIRPMIEHAPKGGPVLERLQTILQDWEERRVTAKDLVTTVEKQLQERLSTKMDAGNTASRAFTSFFNDRGRNLTYGVLAFAIILVVMRILRRIILALIGTSRNRTFPVRLGAFIFDIATVATAFGTTIAIFNHYNDWFLTGFMLLVFIAIGWFILKSLPSLFEQITLLLNLGAVQEGERVVINGVPWQVVRLDLYSDLENPLLRGGAFTIPVRELKGQHSRPVDDQEKWFPCNEGDWVVLDNGLWAEVELQTPEWVHLREEGGAVTYLTTQMFLDQNPKNVSTNYRATVEFGIDYSHQPDAAGKIPGIIQGYVDKRVREVFGSDKILATYVTLFRAGPSSLDYEIEVDVTSGMGNVYETVEHSIARFAIECCTENGWTIPFPQLTVHRQ